MTENAIDAGARIVDRGYHHYDGTRLGPAHATQVMVWAAMRRALGIRRPARAKILPWLLILAAYGPVIVLLGMSILAPGPSSQSRVPYDRLYASLTIVFALFAGLAAPDLLCADRRERVLSLYFASPITRWRYVGAQAVALAVLMLLLTLAPMLILFAGNALLASSAAAYVGNHLDDLRAILLSGSLLAVYYGALAMAVAAFTDRRAYATGAFLGLLLVSSAAGSILWRGMRFPGHERFALVDLLSLPGRVVEWLFGAPLQPDLPIWAYAGGAGAVIVVSLALLVWRYAGVSD